jgi:hypothetical protein
MIPTEVENDDAVFEMRHVIVVPSVEAAEFLDKLEAEALRDDYERPEALKKAAEIHRRLFG